MGGGRERSRRERIRKAIVAIVQGRPREVLRDALNALDRADQVSLLKWAWGVIGGDADERARVMKRELSKMGKKVQEAVRNSLLSLLKQKHVSFEIT